MNISRLQIDLNQISFYYQTISTKGSLFTKLDYPLQIMLYLQLLTKSCYKILRALDFVSNHRHGISLKYYQIH